jgi:phosphoenolpyruvate carboxylase
LRNIPATMATQHPDNANAPYWDTSDPFINVHKETDEAYICLHDMGTSEYMWDWEGKHADASVIDRLFINHYDYFKDAQLGKDKFLTFRVPNIWEEKGYNLLQAMTVLLSSEDFARDLKLKSRPLFEVILPMTERADQILHMQKLFEKLAKFKSEDFTPDSKANSTYLELIPLVESVQGQVSIKDLLNEYLKIHNKHFKFNPKYLRVFLACSDSALSAGFLAGVLGNKLALARLGEFQKESGIKIYPIAGPGSLPFRGGLKPSTIERFIQEYPGVKTVSVQSSFRYDHPKAEVIKAIQKLEKELPDNKFAALSNDTQKTILEIINIATGFYEKSINKLIPDMQVYFKEVPKRRERHQHIGLLAYSRSLGSQTLPRAITFTGGFYSIGVPPEFIGIGRALDTLKDTQIEVLKSVYPSLKEDLKLAGRYLNMKNLNKLAITNKAWLEIIKDVELVQDFFSIKLGAVTKQEKAHHSLSSRLTGPSKNKALLINEMAKLRSSLG